MKNLNEMSLVELEELQFDLERQLILKRQKERLERVKSKEDIFEEFSKFGYIIPNGAKIWRILSGDLVGAYGMEIGRYTHNCHLDMTDFVVLLVVDNSEHFVKDVSSHRLEKVFTF